MPAVYDHLGEKPEYLQGWVEGLRVALRNQTDIHLGYASVCPESFAPFVSQESAYYCILAPRAHRFMHAWFDQWRHRIDFPGAIGRCLQIIDQFQPDVIHVNGTEGFYGMLQTQVNVPVVVSLQGILTAYEIQYFRGFSTSDLLMQLPTKDFIRGGGMLHRFWTFQKAARREIEIIRATRFFVGRTEFDRSFVELYNPIAEYFYCQEALRPEFYAADWNVESIVDDSIYCVCNADPYKGIACLLESVALVKTRRPGIRLRISGAFRESDLWSRLARKVKNLELADNVTWLGTSSPQVVAEEMARASLFVHPSYIDNSPNSLAEALLVGVPCIASYVGGIPSMITNEENGLLVPAGDPYSLASRIFRLLEDLPFKKAISTNARRRAQERHNPAAIAARMSEIYGLVAAHLPANSGIPQTTE